MEHRSAWISVQNFKLFGETKKTLFEYPDGKMSLGRLLATLASKCFDKKNYHTFFQLKIIERKKLEFF